MPPLVWSMTLSSWLPSKGNRWATYMAAPTVIISLLLVSSLVVGETAVVAWTVVAAMDLPSMAPHWATKLSGTDALCPMFYPLIIYSQQLTLIQLCLYFPSLNHILYTTSSMMYHSLLLSINKTYSRTCCYIAIIYPTWHPTKLRSCHPLPLPFLCLGLVSNQPQRWRVTNIDVSAMGWALSWLVRLAWSVLESEVCKCRLFVWFTNRSTTLESMHHTHEGIWNMDFMSPLDLRGHHGEHSIVMWKALVGKYTCSFIILRF